MARSSRLPLPAWLLLAIVFLAHPFPLSLIPTTAASPLLARLHLTLTPHTSRTISAQACDGDPYREIVLCLYAAWVSPSLGRAFALPWTSSSLGSDDTYIQPGAIAHLYLPPLLAHISRRGAELDVSTRKASNQAVSVDVLLPWLLRSVHQHSKHLVLSCASNVADLSKISPDFLPYLAEALPLLQMMPRSPNAQHLGVAANSAAEAALIAAQGAAAIGATCLDPLRRRGGSAYLFLDDSLVVPEPEALRAALRGVRGAVVTVGSLLVSASEPAYDTWVGPSLACVEPDYPVASAIAALGACIGATLSLLSVPSDLSLMCLSARQAQGKPVRYLHFGGSDFTLLPGLVRPAWVFQGCDEGLDELDAAEEQDGGNGSASWEDGMRGGGIPGGESGEDVWADNKGQKDEADVVSEAVRSAVEVGRLVPVCLTSSRRARVEANDGSATGSSWSGAFSTSSRAWAAGVGDAVSQTLSSAASGSSSSHRHSHRHHRQMSGGRRLHSSHDSGSGSVTPADPGLLSPSFARLLPHHLAQELRLHFNPCSPSSHSSSDSTSDKPTDPSTLADPDASESSESDPASEDGTLITPGRGCYHALLSELATIYGPFLLTSPSLIFQNQAHLRELARWDTGVPLSSTPAVLSGLATPVFYNPQQRRMYTHLPEVLPTVLRRHASASLSLTFAASAAAAAEAAPALLRPFQAAVSASHVYVPNALLMYFPGGSTPSEIVSFFLTGGCSSVAAPAPSFASTIGGDYAAGHSRRRLKNFGADPDATLGPDSMVKEGSSNRAVGKQRTSGRQLQGVSGPPTPNSTLNDDGTGRGDAQRQRNIVPLTPEEMQADYYSGLVFGRRLQGVADPDISDGMEDYDMGTLSSSSSSSSSSRRLQESGGEVTESAKSLCYEVLKGSLCQYLQPSERFDPAGSYGRLHMICMSLFSAYSINTCHAPLIQ